MWSEIYQLFFFAPSQDPRICQAANAAANLNRTAACNKNI
jgi:hypothetical protein